MPLNNLYSVFLVKPGPDGKVSRHLAGRFLTAGNHLQILEDYHNLLHGNLDEGPLEPRSLNQIHRLHSSQYLDTVSQSDLDSGKRPEYLPEADLGSRQRHPASAFEYRHSDGDAPDHVEFREGIPHVNGAATSHAHIRSLIDNVNSGRGSVRYHRDMKSEIAKAESVFKELSKADDLNESMGALRALVQSGQLDPRHERILANYIYNDPMIPEIGNKLSHTDFLSRPHEGVHIMGDANDFKSINDRYGHPAGDAAIKAMGRAAREAMDETVGKDNAKVWRIGGDEMAFHVPTHEDAAKFIRAYRQKLDAIEPIAGTHKLSMSFGIGQNHEDADKALYEAKKQKYTPETRNLPEGQRVKSFGVGQAPHLAHSLVPGHEGPIPLGQAPAEIQAPPAPDLAKSEVEDEDPWVEAKYRRGGHEEFLKWLEVNGDRDLDEENKAFFSDGLAKARPDYSALYHQKIPLTGLYRAYKSSPHHPRSLLLKYIVNRLTDPVYKTGTPDQIVAHENDWLKFHQSGKAGEKNGQVQIEDLHQALADNPELPDKVLAHQKKLHEFIRTVSPHRIVRVGGEEYVPLARGMKTDKIGREHSISSWTDRMSTAMNFGRHVLQHLVPLKNIWYSYDVGPKASTSKAFGNEDELLVSPGGQLEAASVPGASVGLVVPRKRHDVSNKTLTASDQIHVGDPRVSPEALMSVMEDPRTPEDSATATLAMKHPNINPSVLGRVLSKPSQMNRWIIDSLKLEAAEHPQASSENLHQALSDPMPDIKHAAMRNPNLTPEHISRVLREIPGYSRILAMEHQNASPENLGQGLKDTSDSAIRRTAARHRNMTPELIHTALDDADNTVRMAAAQNKNASSENIHKAMSDKDRDVRYLAAKNPNSTPEHLARALEDPDPVVWQEVGHHPNATPELMEKYNKKR